MSIRSLKKIYHLVRNDQNQAPDTNSEIKNINCEIVCSQENDQSQSRKFHVSPKHHQTLNAQNQLSQNVNQIIVWKGYHDGQSKSIYYIPSYLRFQINRVNRIDHVGCSAQIDVSIYLWLMLKPLPKKLQQEIIQNGQIKINGCSSIKLKNIEIRKNNRFRSQNLSELCSQFSVHQTITMQVQSDNFLSPFQLMNLQGKLQMKQFKLENSSQNIEVAFNFMETQPFLHFKFNELRNLGNYQLAESRIAMKFTNEQYFGKMNFFVDKAGQIVQEIILPSFLKNKFNSSIQQTSSKEPPNQFKNVTVIITLYKYPMTNMLTIFLPFYLLALLCLGVFFTANIMGMRSLSIFLLLMSYMAMIPGIRRNIPPTPSLILVEILIYLQAICIVAIFAQSLSIRSQQNYVFQWKNDSYFLFVLIFTLISLIVVLSLCFIHKFVWEPSYNMLSDQTKKKLCGRFNTDEWYNDSCQLYFNKYKINNELQFPYSIKNIEKLQHRKVRKISQKIKFVQKKKK